MTYLMLQAQNTDINYFPKIMSVDKILNQLKQEGFRSTKVRQALLEILWSETCLLSLIEIQQRLRARKLRPNRSTLYRELKFLTEKKILNKNSIAGKDLYELPRDHHHHLVCVECGELTKVELESHLREEEKKLEKQFGFRIARHELEFYGVCEGCQKKEIDQSLSLRMPKVS